MPYLFYTASVILMLAMPLALGTWLARRYRTNWGHFGVGAATFAGSQLLHIPFNSWVGAQGWLPETTAGLRELLLIALFLGLSAGLFEESFRYLSFRFWARDARRWADALMVGAGHGGVESILLGLNLALQLLVLAGVRAGRFQALIPAGQWAYVQAQAEEIFGGPALMALLPGVERALAIVLHLSLSVLVLQCFVRGGRRWWLFAVLWHALANFLALVTFRLANAYAAEAVLGVVALLSLLIIRRLRQADPALVVRAPAHPGAPPPRLEPLPLNEERLDDSRYL